MSSKKINLNDKITENFTWREFIFSPTAERNGIDNIPNSDEVYKNIEALVKNVLQKVRDYYKSPVRISSGYRSPKLNKLVGGSSTSQHMTGEAADFIVVGVDNYEVADYIRKNLLFDQLILEYYGGGNVGWIHVSYSRSRNRKQVLTINRRGRFNGLVK